MSRKKYVECEINIEKNEFPNKGIGYYGDKKVSVKNTITGQKVRIQLKKKKQKYEGRLLEILEKADYEITPACKSFNICGGCTYQNISYEKELEIKKNNVLEILARANIKDFEFLGVSRNPDIAYYRNKMEFSFGDNGKIEGQESELSLGMRKRNTNYEVVTEYDCNITSSDVMKVVKCVLEYFNKGDNNNNNNKEKFYHKMRKTGALRHLLVRQAKFTGEMVVSLITTSELSTELETLTNNLLELNNNIKGEIVGISHIVNDGVADAIKVDKFNNLYGRDYFYENLLGLKFKISLFSFFQTNSSGAEYLYSIVRDFVGNIDNQIVFDLYCGTGTIAQIVAQNAKKVIGIEIVEEAIESAKENAKLNNINNCEFIAGDVYKTVESLNQDEDNKPDVIILDPPREGINPKAISKISNFGAKKLVYISCKASSLANDLPAFIEQGYKVTKIQMMDMFSRTYHIETVVELIKK
ncbi:MAG: 23S rRNA (uracil(1939)-C(5))-methyltransferase RlmD [bacterium]